MAEVHQLVKRQDLPPPGGYKPIPFKRVPAKSYFSGYTMFAGYIGVTVGALYLYNLNYKQIKRNEIEMRSAKMAIYPMLLAERDREFLKQIRRNRDAEAELMRDVPGWEVGTYFGERVYKLTPQDKLIEPIFHEFYAHTDPHDWFQRVGTYFGERVYKLTPQDKLIEPIFHEFYAHTDPHDWFQRVTIKLRS